MRLLGEEEHVPRRDDLSALPGATAAAARRVNRLMRAQGELDSRVPGIWAVAMGEEVNRTRTGEHAQHLALIRKLALNA